jgi:iron complex outermembrane receptor protein
MTTGESMMRTGRWQLVGLVGVLTGAAAPLGVHAADSATAVMQLEEVVVTGSRLSTPSAAAPVTVFDAARIQEMGASTIADVLKYLPQQPFSRGEEYRFGGAQFAELRGVGADTTLVLINGRRASVTAANAASNAFDLNTIPVSAIERVEVLSDAASAVYGADAVGGVVNIILKREIAGVDASVRYGAAQGGAEERRASLASGFASDRVRASVVVDWFERESLLGAQRERWRDQDYSRYGSTDQRAAQASPGNVSSLSGENLPGLSDPIAAVPQGASGIGMTPADFVSTAGEMNLESLTRYQSIVPESQRKGAIGSLEFDVSPRVSAFIEAMYVDRTQRSLYTPPSVSGIATRENPFNPFGEDVWVDVLLNTLPTQLDVVDSQSARGVAGVRGTLERWSWEASFVKARDRASSWSEHALDYDAVAAALASDDPAKALNPFRDGAAGSDALLSSLAAPRDESRYTSDAQQWSAFVRGPIASLPAGPFEIVLGGEGRREGILFDSFFRVEHERDVMAGFVEARVPLVDPSMNVGGVSVLELALAAREDHYSDFGNTTNPQVTLSWLPVSAVAVRATYGTSFRPPSLFELYSPRTELSGEPVSDPRRDGETSIATVVIGGNPELEPITADSWSIGVRWTPAAMAGAEVSAMYWAISMEDRVNNFTRELVLANEALFPERVVRSAATPADVAAGRPGQILSVDTSRINFGTLETSGIDVSSRWPIESRWGTWVPEVAATYVDRYVAGSAPGTPTVDRMDVANVDGSITAWRGQVGLRWLRNVWGASLFGRYIPSYQDADYTGTPVGRRIDAQWLLDAQLSIDIAAPAQSSWLQGVAVQLGATNVLNEMPPYAEIGSPFGYDFSQGDLRGRFIYLNLSKHF